MRLGRWIGWSLLAIAVTLVLAHVTWSLIESGGLRNQIAALKAAGEPIVPKDFQPPPDGPDNGGNDIMAAGKAVGEYADAHREYAMLSAALPLRPQERSTIDASLAALPDVSAKLDAARAKPRHDWNLDLRSPVLINMALQDMSHVRALVTHLGYVALLDHERGDDRSAMARVDQILFVSRFADRHPSLVGHLVSIGCAALACDKVFEMTPDLKIGTGPKDASPQDVRKMIAVLLDDAPSQQGLRLAFRGERMCELDAVESLLNGSMSGATSPGGTRPNLPRYTAFSAYVFRPLFHRNGKVMLKRTTAILSAVDSPDLPAFRAKVPPAPPKAGGMNFLADILMPSFDRAIQTEYRFTSDRRMAAIVLAIRLYALEHAGKRPATLAELVPKYLPAVPNDALLSNKPIGYVPDGERPRLYDAGENNVDDGGKDDFIRPYSDGRRPQRGDEWRTLDRCVYLDRLPRPAPEANESNPSP
jgi:hypothetical protein